MDIAFWWRRFLKHGIDRQAPVQSLLRAPRWLAACMLGIPQTAHFSTGGLKMRLAARLRNFGSTSIYMKRDRYEPELLAVQRLIEPGSVVLDIGGSFGIFSLFMAHFTGPGGKVHTFEPGKFSFAQLSENIAMNDVADRIVLHNVAASDQPATLKLFHVGDAPVTFSVGGAEGIAAEEVPAVRIADQITVEDAARVSFIKIDVEGYEISALEGARPILQTRHPAIMFEVSADALRRQNQAPTDVFTYLASYGYSFWMLRDNCFVPQIEACEGNVFASMDDLSAA
ncbi:MAG: FkbM family methyltransferase [Novosphingobium sp.]